MTSPSPSSMTIRPKRQACSATSRSPDVARLGRMGLGRDDDEEDDGRR